MQHLLLYAAIGLTIPFIGCSGLNYVEQPTPPGQVAPPVAAQSVQPYRTPNAQHRPAAESTTIAAAGTPYRTNSSDRRDLQPMFSSAAIVPRFSEVYRAQGQPRLAIFFNRALSDEVREWKTTDRGVMVVEGKFSTEGDGRNETFEGPGGAGVYHQSHVQDARRSSPGEAWMWRFEEGFMRPFLEARALVVDRATILRLTAAASGQQGSAWNPMAVKKIEMDSLKGNADLFLEILIRREPQSSIGYEFRATAKEVDTGIIRAYISSADWNYGSGTDSEVVATSSGYRFVDKKESLELPDIRIVSKDLALALMRAMADNWQ